MIRLSIYALIVSSLFIIQLPLFGSHYPLNSVNVTTVEENYKLFKVKIFSTKELFMQLRVKKNRKALADKLQMSGKRLLDLARSCDLLRIKGIGPKIVVRLGGCGVFTIKQLQGQDAENLKKKMDAYRKKMRFVDPNPPVDLLKVWIERSKNLEILLEE